MTPFQSSLADLRAMAASLAAFESRVGKAGAAIADCLLGGRKLLVAGNGGSAADGADFATEFACRFSADRRPFPALNLAGCGSLLTATGNDYGCDEVFARSVRAFGKEGDIFVGISTSGDSANIVTALKAARDGGLFTIAMLGRDGGKAAGIADLEFIVPANATARIQEAHKFLLHCICEQAEPALAGAGAPDSAARPAE